MTRRFLSYNNLGITRPKDLGPDAKLKVKVKAKVKAGKERRRRRKKK